MNTTLSRACLAGRRSTALRRKHRLSIAALVHAGEGRLLTGDGRLPVAAIKKTFIRLKSQSQIERHGERKCWDGLDEQAATLTRFLQRNREWAASQARDIKPIPMPPREALQP